MIEPLKYNLLSDGTPIFSPEEMLDMAFKINEIIEALNQLKK